MSIDKKNSMRGMTIGGGHKRPTKSGAGLTAKGKAAKNPNSRLRQARKRWRCS